MLHLLYWQFGNYTCRLQGLAVPCSLFPVPSYQRSIIEKSSDGKGIDKGDDDGPPLAKWADLAIGIPENHMFCQVLSPRPRRKISKQTL